MRAAGMAVLLGAIAGATLTARTRTQLQVQTADQEPVRVGGDVPAPRLLRDVAPRYPPEAMREHVEGAVWVELTVGVDGHVSAARIIQSVPLLDQAALDAVKQWEFSRPIVNGVPRPVIVTGEVSFATNAGGKGRTRISGPDASLLPDDQVREQPLLIAPGRAGLVQVGMTIDRLLRMFPGQTRLLDPQSQARFTPAIAIRLDPSTMQPSLIVASRQVAEQWRVAEIDVRDPRFHTSDGLGVGSTLAQIRAREPGVEPAIGVAGPSVSLRDGALSFWFDPARLSGSTVPDSATVTRVTVRASRPIDSSM
jgi:TonB family protein